MTIKSVRRRRGAEPAGRSRLVNSLFIEVPIGVAMGTMGIKALTRDEISISPYRP